MKLLIELDEKRFEDIKRIASIQIRRRSLTCEQIIANGTPLEEELRKLWLQIYNIDDSNHDFEGFYHCQNEALELINKKISESKGE